MELDQVWIDNLKRGPMLRQVRGPGKLVPEEMRRVTAAFWQAPVMLVE